MKPETLSEAVAWDARRDAYAESGLTDRAAAAAAWNQPKTPDYAEMAACLKMIEHDSDAKVARDLDCYPCGACRKVTCPVCEYAKARRKATGFSAKNYAKNSHRKVPELTLRRIKKLAEAPAKTKRVQCQNCDREFDAKRTTAKWCSPRCRVAGNAA